MTGAVALAAFVVVHLVVRASALGGAATYDAVAGSLAVRVIELVIGVPLLCIAGVYLVRVIARSGKEAEVERYGSVRFWVAQRVSAAAILVFACAHLWEFPIQRIFFGLSQDAVYTQLTAHLSRTAAGIPWIALFYLVGIFAVALHVSNALFAATGRRRLTVGLGFVIFALGAATVVSSATGMRLVSSAGGDSAPPGAPCGTDVPQKAPVLPAPSR